MADPLSSVLVALATFLGFGAIEPRTIIKGEIASVFPDASSPGEVVGNVLLIIDAPFTNVLDRLENPMRQPGVLAGGRLETETEGTLDQFLKSARMDDGDSERLRNCRAGQCRLKITDTLLKAQQTLPSGATDPERAQTHLRAMAALAPCVREPSCELTLIDRKSPVPLAPVARRIHGLPSLLQHLPDGARLPRPTRVEWRTESYWKREVISLGRVQLIEGQLGGRRAILHRREVAFATHYFEGARVETLFVEVAGRLVVAQSNIFQTDKKSGFNSLERALIRMLGRRRFEAQASEWRKERGGLR